MANRTHENTEKLLDLTVPIDEQNNVEVIVKYNGDIKKLEEELRVEVELLDFNYAIITLKPGQIRELYNNVEIEYIEIPKIITFNLEQELSAVCLPTIENSTYDLTGKGTIVAIIDSGIDFTHPDFINEDSTSRILFIWDQSGSGSPPSGFKEGAEYTNEQINEALKSNNPYSVVSQRDTNRTWNSSCWSRCSGMEEQAIGMQRGIASRCGYYSRQIGEKRARIVCKDNRNNESYKICN